MCIVSNCLYSDVIVLGMLFIILETKMKYKKILKQILFFKLLYEYGFL